eukprot:1604120-Prymnesium_polylepis.1
MDRSSSSHNRNSLAVVRINEEDDRINFREVVLPHPTRCEAKETYNQPGKTLHKSREGSFHNVEYEGTYLHAPISCPPRSKVLNLIFAIESSSEAANKKARLVTERSAAGLCGCCSAL